MIDLQTAVGSMVTFLLSGGPEAINELIKGVVVGGAQDASDLWHQVFRKRPESKALAERLAHDPQDTDARTQIQQSLEHVFREHPELLQRAGNIQIIRADDGSVAAGEISGSTITINN